MHARIIIMRVKTNSKIGTKLVVEDWDSCRKKEMKDWKQMRLMAEKHSWDHANLCCTTTRRKGANKSQNPNKSSPGLGKWRR